MNDYLFLYENENRSVIYKKNNIDGIDKNDYVSLATYYWPNLNTKDGLPYILKDGLSNPEGDNYDKQNLRELAFMIYYQCILYYLSDDKKYYEIIKKNINYYFLDKKTGMNPNMNHGQMIKGVNLGRGIGLIDFTANMSYALYMLKLLNDINYIEKDFYDKLKKWLEKFYKWYVNSEIALEEKYALNNHGIFYDFGLIVLSDILNKEVVSLVYQMVELRIKKQIIEGKMPLELKRTKSKNYALMAIKGIYDFSTISSKYGYNLYEINKWYKDKIEIDIMDVEDYLYEKLINKTSNWNYEQIINFDEATLLPLIFEKSKSNHLKLNDIYILSKDEILVDLQYVLLTNLTK